MRVPLTVRAREETSGHVDAAAWGLSPGTVRGARCNKGGLAPLDSPGQSTELLLCKNGFDELCETNCDHRIAPSQHTTKDEHTRRTRSLDYNCTSHLRSIVYWFYLYGIRRTKGMYIISPKYIYHLGVL